MSPSHQRDGMIRLCGTWPRESRWRKPSIRQRNFFLPTSLSKRQTRGDGFFGQDRASEGTPVLTLQGIVEVDMNGASETTTSGSVAECPFSRRPPSLARGISQKNAKHRRSRGSQYHDRLYFPFPRSRSYETPSSDNFSLNLSYCLGPLIYYMFLHDARKRCLVSVGFGLSLESVVGTLCA